VKIKVRIEMNVRQNNKDIELSVDRENFWQLSSLLEEGRNQVLRMVARNEQLSEILNTLCQKAQIYNADMLCSILRLDNEAGTLHPIASVSLPKFYCDALEGVHIGAGIGSCGTAAFLKERVIVEDINTHPYWSLYKELALSAGVQACWSEPIIGADGIVFGTFAMYYREPKKPSDEDIKFIELSANLAAVVFDNNANREKLLTANFQLNQTVDERNKELEIVNLSLEKALSQQSKHHDLNLHSEKMNTTNSLLCGFSHELNTPIGNALIAISAAEEKLEILQTTFNSKQLTRSHFVNKISELSQAIEINKANLEKTINLLNRFREVNTSNSLEATSVFEFKTMFTEFHSGLFSLLGPHTLNFECNVDKISCSKLNLCQVLFHLIDNSVEHGFVEKVAGLISINATKKMAILF
jgi:signal transduction histidine kinase